MSETPEMIQTKLDAALAEQAKLRTAAGAMLGKLQRLHAGVEALAAGRVDAATQALAALAMREAGPFWSGWQTPAWTTFTGEKSAKLFSHMRAGQIPDETGLPSEKLTPDLAALVPLLAGNGPIIVLCNAQTQAQARKMLQSMVLRIALGMPSEIRFTLIDPVGLGANFPFRYGLPRVRSTGRSPADELHEVIEDIRRINERVIGHTPRFSDLTADQRAGENFEIIAAVDFPKAYVKDPRAVEHLLRVGNSGPRTGRHLLLEMNMDDPLPHDFSIDQFQNAVLIDLRQPGFAADELPDGQAQRRWLELSAKAGQQQQSGDWNSAIRPDSYFTGTSEHRVETPAGERLKFWLGHDDEGAPSAHAIIAGQTGSGKSSLLHVLITGLAARYSPAELRFVLIDGKDGIEFEAYRQLPQAEIICLRTAPALARSVLADFVAEMEERYRLFQAAGAVNLHDYRSRTGQVMPRKLLVVDEYQQLLDGDEERGGLLLTRILEKGRAAGTHVVLASQTFNVRGMPPTAATHIHTRAALALAPDYVQSIQLFGAEGKRLIRELAPSGQVVMNDQNGRDGANSRGAVARFQRGSEGHRLQDAIQSIIDAAGQPGQPLVLNGRDAVVVSSNPFVQSWRDSPPDAHTLQEVARRPTRNGGFGMEGWSAADRPLGLWVGRRFDVHGHALCALRRAPAQNLLVLGAHVEIRNRMLASTLAALVAMLPPAALEVTLIDGLGPDMPGGGMLRLACAQLAAAGAKVSLPGTTEIQSALAGLEAVLASGAPSAVTRLLLIAEPDYLYTLHGGADRFVAPTSGPAASLRTILNRGAQAGLHTVLTASGLPAFGTVFSPSREARFFNHRAVQQMNEDESMTLFASLAGARINTQAEHPFAALLVDQIQGTRAGLLFNAYAADADPGKPQDLAALSRQLDLIVPRAAAYVT